VLNFGNLDTFSLCCIVQDTMKDQINQIIKNLENHDQRFDKVEQRFDKIDQRFDFIDKRLDSHDQRFDKVEQHLARHDQQLETIAITVVDIQKQVNDIKETMATKTDIAKISNTLDVLVGLHKKTDQELTFMGVRVKRIEEKTEKNTKDIQKIKPLVGLKTT